MLEDICAMKLKDDITFSVKRNEDKQIVLDAIKGLVAQGVYKEKLFE